MPITLGKRRRFQGIFTALDNITPAYVDETQQEVAALTTNGAIEAFEKVLDADGKVIGAKGAVRPASPGPVEIQVTGDADRGDGVRTLTLVGTETCIVGEAFGGSVVLNGDDED